MLLTTYLQGEARSAGQLLAALARQIAATGQPVPRPAWIAIGGETTVTLHGSGLGGRNLELALGAVTEFDGIPNAVLITLATDGEDGPTDAAGAVVSGETLSAARQKGLHPAAFLANHDSYRFFEKMGDILRPGSTGTNVNDLAFLVLW
jgi:hydroxypyruvate reductase